jgi:hypothetical protein
VTLMMRNAISALPFPYPYPRIQHLSARLILRVYARKAPESCIALNNMDALKMFANKAGDVAAAAKEKASAFSEAHDIKGKAAQMKESMKSGYESTTGRNAEVDGMLIKVGAAGAKASVMTATAPAMAAMSNAARDVGAAATKGFETVTGRDATTDKASIGQVVHQVSNNLQDVGSSFKSGMAHHGSSTTNV